MSFIISVWESLFFGSEKISNLPNVNIVHSSSPESFISRSALKPLDCFSLHAASVTYRAIYTAPALCLHVYIQDVLSQLLKRNHFKARTAYWQIAQLHRSSYTKRSQTSTALQSAAWPSKQLDEKKAWKQRGCASLPEFALSKMGLIAPYCRWKA